MLAEGALVGGHYRILGVLGRGGMGQVFRAVDERSDREVALKSTDLGRWGPAQREVLLDQFRREGQTLLRLQHPNLPAFLDYLEEDDQAFLVMELIPGQNLAERVMRQGPLGEAELLSTLESLTSLLVYLHGQSPPVIFRDLKPANVMLDQGGTLKLIDFGLAKSLPGGSQEPTQTSARGMVSPGFAAPEQYSGGTDERSDLYALGATAYYLATAATPADSVERVASAASLPSPDRLNPELSSATALLITQLMQLKRDQRPESAAEVLQRLRRKKGDVDTMVVPPPAAPPAARRRRWPLAGVCLGLVSVGGWWMFSSSSSALHVETIPAGARVVVDQQPLGTTPCNLTVKTKSELRLELSGYYPVVEHPARFSREDLSLLVELQPGQPAPGQKQEEMPGYYPPSLGGPPWPMVPSRSASLDGHGYGLFDEFKDWSKSSPSPRVLELHKGDGRRSPRYEVRFESVPPAPVDDLLAAEIARREPNWKRVRSLREPHTALAYFERTEGAAAGRAAWLVRLGPKKALTLRLEISPCVTPYELLKILDLLRSGFRLGDGDPV